MNPTNDQPTESSAYLDQIAPKKTGKFGLPGNKITIIGVILGIATIITAILVIIAAVMPEGSNPNEHLGARLLSTQDTADKATANIKNTRLRAMNSNLKIYLANTIRDITPILASNKIAIKSLDKKVTLAESNSKTLETLEDARLNSTYDRTYAREMSYQLETLLSLMREIKDTTNSSKMESFLTSSIDNLAPTQKEFADFNATNG